MLPKLILTNTIIDNKIIYGLFDVDNLCLLDKWVIDHKSSEIEILYDLMAIEAYHFDFKYDNLISDKEV